MKLNKQVQNITMRLSQMFVDFFSKYYLQLSNMLSKAGVLLAGNSEILMNASQVPFIKRN